MKILHLTGTLNAGGIERMVTELAEDQKQRGHQPAVCCLTERSGIFLSRLESQGIPVFEAAAQGRPWHLVNRLAKAIRVWQPDIIHSHVNYSLIWQAGALMTARVSARWILTQHTLLTYTTPDRLRSALFYRIARPWIRVHTAVSKTAARHAAKLYCLSEEKFRIIPVGVTPQRFKFDPAARCSLREEWKLPPEAILIGSVGRLDVVKGYDLFLPIFAQARSVNPRLYLAVVGEGEKMSALQQQASRLGCAKCVYWLGFRQDIAQVLSSFDVYVQPSRWESGGIAVLEALSNGLSVIASRVEGLAELARHSQSIRIIDIADTESWILTLGNSSPSNEKQRYSHCPDQYQFEKTSLEYLETYEEAMRV